MIRPWLIFLVVFSLFLAGCSEDKKEQQAPTPAQEMPPLPVEVIKVSNEKVPIWVEYSGKTEATKRIEITARVSGVLEQILFSEGDYVNAGDTLFIIEKDTYEAALAQANANYERDKASLSLAKKDVERYTPLVEEDLAPRAQLDQYKARVAELEAALKANDAAIKNAEVSLSYTEIRAPITGRISRKLVDVGNVVGPGASTVLTTIVSDDPMYVYFNPTEEEFQVMQQYKSQDRMDAVVNVPGDTVGMVKRGIHRGKVDFSDNRVDLGTGTITMRAEVSNPDHSMLEGTFVYIEIMITDDHAMILVPPGIVQEDQLGSFLYVVDENDMAKRITITTGYQNRLYLIVQGGLTGGERVVTTGFAKIREGMKVTPTDVTDTRGVLAIFREKGMLPAGE